MRLALLIAAGWSLIMPTMLYGWYRICLRNNRVPAPPPVVYGGKPFLVGSSRTTARRRAS